MISAAAMKAMAARGATLEMIIAAVEADEADERERKAESRELSRIRSKNYRERERQKQVTSVTRDARDAGKETNQINGHVTRDGELALDVPHKINGHVTPITRDERDAVGVSPLPPLSPLITPLTPPSPKQPKAKRAGARLPSDWKLTDKNREYARDKGMSDPEIDFEDERFKNHWWQASGPNAVKLDWDAAWRNWVTSPYRASAKRNFGGSNEEARRNTDFDRVGQTVSTKFRERNEERNHDIQAAGSRLIDRLTSQFGVPDAPSGSRENGAPNVRALPKG